MLRAQKKVGVWPCTTKRAGFHVAPAHLPLQSTYAFSGAASLTRIELDGSGVRHLVAGQFKDCTSLGGALHFMNVTWVGSRKGTFVFTGCPDITEIHFAVENEEAITSLSQYQNDPTLGTGTAVCIFDL